MSKSDNLPAWLWVNAWREIFARIFENVETHFNARPEWLVNPVTNRRLKLDMLYPEIGIAVRFEGLEGKRRRSRPSLEEEDQQRARDHARVEVCQAHGINLVVLTATSDSAKTVFQKIDLMLSRAGQRINDTMELPHKIEVMQKIRQARAIGADISHRIDRSDNLELYAELWQDRQYQMPEKDQVPGLVKNTIPYTVGMEVEHITFGPGVIIAVTPNDDDALVIVDFVTAGQKTLAASLVGDKLAPR